MAEHLVKPIENFGKMLFKIAAREKKNLICSPISAHVVLSMLSAGADGDTKTALMSKLGIENPMKAAQDYGCFLENVNKLTKNNGIILSLANKIYVSNTNPIIKPDFSECLANCFFSEAAQIDFKDNTKAARTINDWVENKTNKKIKDLIDAKRLSDATKLVLINAIYFKGKWEKPFDPEDTHKKKFYLLDESEVECNMMHLKTEFGFLEDETLKADVLEMNYEGTELKMLFFLPKNKLDFNYLEDNIHKFDFSNFKEKARCEMVDVYIPRFKIVTKVPMTEILKEMGLNIIFSEKASFENISKGPLKVDEVLQKAFIEVNEEGAEAAGATSVDIGKFLTPSIRNIREFIANRPFMFALTQEVGEKNIVLFLGHFVSPDVGK